MPAPHLNRPLISVERLWRAAPLALPASQKAFRFLLRGCSEAALRLQEAPSPAPQAQAHPEAWGSSCFQENLQQTGDWSKRIMLCPPSPQSSRYSIWGVLCTEVPALRLAEMPWKHTLALAFPSSLSHSTHSLPLGYFFPASLSNSASCTRILVSGSAFRGIQTKDHMKVLLTRVAWSGLHFFKAHFSCRVSKSIGQKEELSGGPDSDTVREVGAQHWAGGSRGRETRLETNKWHLVAPQDQRLSGKVE